MIRVKEVGAGGELPCEGIHVFCSGSVLTYSREK